MTQPIQSLTKGLLFSLALLFCTTTTTQAQIQCCCTDVGCFAGNAGFDCDTWCPLLGLGANMGSNTPYPDPGTCAAACVLPIELESFGAEATDRGGVRINWVTSAELDNEGFEIQRMSGVKLTWETLGFVDGKGTTIETNEYSFLDENPPMGINYYRLKQLDYSGLTSYSEVDAVNFDATAVFSFWPTIASDYLFLIFNTDDALDASFKIEVHNLMGQKVLEQISDEKALDIQRLQAGNYLISYHSHGQVYTQRFIKVSQ